MPLATMVWVWQFRDRKTVDAADYRTLLRKADTILKDDVLASKELPVMSGGSVTLNMLMDEDAQFPTRQCRLFQNQSVPEVVEGSYASTAWKARILSSAWSVCTRSGS